MKAYDFVSLLFLVAFLFMAYSLGRNTATQKMKQQGRTRRDWKANRDL